jgi:hypothetical protein
VSGGAVRVGVLVQGGVDDDAPRPAVVVVVVVDEDRLADEGPVGLLDLLGRELVEVVVAPAGDRPGADVQEAGLGVVVEDVPVRSIASRGCGCSPG